MANIPYDPDMTVTEALEKGLVVILENGRLTPPWKQACGAQAPDDRPSTTAPLFSSVPFCGLPIDHEGPHAYLTRWMEQQASTAEAMDLRRRHHAAQDPDDKRRLEPRIERAVRQFEEESVHLFKEAQRARRAPQSLAELTEHVETMTEEMKETKRVHTSIELKLLRDESRAVMNSQFSRKHGHTKKNPKGRRIG